MIHITQINRGRYVADPIVYRRMLCHRLFKLNLLNFYKPRNIFYIYKSK
jgi:hypothetical protein